MSNKGFIHEIGRVVMMQMLPQGMATGSWRERAHSACSQNFPCEGEAVPVIFSIDVWVKEDG